MIDYTADDVPAAHLEATLAAAARERPDTVVVTCLDFTYPDDIRYRVTVKGISVRGVIALEKATAGPTPTEDAPQPAARPNPLYIDEKP